MTSETDAEVYLTIDQVAERYQLQKSWIYTQVRLNTVPVVRFGRQLRFPVRRWEEMINNH